MTETLQLPGSAGQLPRLHLRLLRASSGVRRGSAGDSVGGAVGAPAEVPLGGLWALAEVSPGAVFWLPPGNTVEVHPEVLVRRRRAFFAGFSKPRAPAGVLFGHRKRGPAGV